jgi:hypothetical protein
LCQRCKRELGQVRKLDGVDHPRGHLVFDKSNIVRGMIREIAKDPTLIYPADGSLSVVTLLKERARTVGPYALGEIERILDIRDDPRSFYCAINVAAYLGASLHDVLRADVRQESLPLTFPSTPSVLERRPFSEQGPRRRRVRRDRQLLLTRIAEELALPLEEAPSLKEVTRRLGVSHGCLRYVAPESVRRIVARHSIRAAREATYRKLRATIVVAEFLAARRAELQPISRKAALRALYPSAGLPKRLLRREINRSLALQPDLENQGFDGDSEHRHEGLKVKH